MSTALNYYLVGGWMTTKEAAAYLRTKPRTLLQWVRDGAVKGYPLHGTKRHTWRFRKEDLDLAMGFIASSTTSPFAVVSSSASSVARLQ